MRNYITIIDDSCCSITLTLWGDMCERNSKVVNGDILAIKGGRVSEYGGKSINVADDHANLTVNPNTKKAK